jgi:hypothetical protein
MKHEDKIKYIQIACGMCGFNIPMEYMDMIISMYELILEKEGNADMKDIARIMAIVKEKYHEKIDEKKK